MKLKQTLSIFALLCVVAGGAFLIRPLLGSRTDWLAELENSPPLTLYSLEPFFNQAPKNSQKLGNYSILGQVTTGEPEKTFIIAGLRRSQGQIEVSASCFNPRLAIQSQDKQTRVLLCFECGNAGGFSRNQKLWFGMAPSSAQKNHPENLMNAIFKEQKIPISQSQISKRHLSK